MQTIQQFAKVPVAIRLNARKGMASSTAPSVAILAPGAVIDSIGYVTDGESINDNSKWYTDNKGNYYWSGGCGTPIIQAAQTVLSESLLYGEMINTAYNMYAADTTTDQTPAPQALPTGWTFDSWIRLEKTASTPIYIQKNEFFGFIATCANPNTIAVIIRGTESIMDWAIDFDFIPKKDMDIGGKVESGFYASYEALKAIAQNKQESTLVARVQALLAVNSPLCVISGHSLGASLACISAASLASAGVTSQQVFLFASPKTGNIDFVNAVNGELTEFYSYINSPDWVPKLPPSGYFEHAGTVQMLDSKDFPNIKSSVGCYHSICTYLYMLGSKNVGLTDSCKVS